MDDLIQPVIERWNDRFICTGIEVGEAIIDMRIALGELENRGE